MDKNQLRVTLEQRFNKNMNRHSNLNFEHFFNNLTEKDLKILMMMEIHEGEPDLLHLPNGEYVIVDTFMESPTDRRSVCYDEDARISRKKFPPEKSAWGMIHELSENLELMNEEVYFVLQETGDFDMKSEVWLDTPADFRQKGDALFGRKRHQRTFIYYNGVQSYYKTRGFRMMYRLDHLALRLAS